MALLTSSFVQDNEVIKAVDVNFGFDSTIDNITKSFRVLLETEKNFVIGGKVTADRAGGLTVDVAPIFGIEKNSGNSFCSTEKIGPIAIQKAEDQDRIDIVQVKGVYEEYDEQQRAFNDFETDIKTYKNVNTKRRKNVLIEVKAGIPGSVQAPETDKGYVKLAEIKVTSGLASLTNDNIENITSDISTVANNNWTNEKDSVYNVGYMSDVNERFRVHHNEDGTHKKNIIGQDELKIGTATQEINGNVLPTGKEISLNGVKKSTTTTIAENIERIALSVTDLFNNYLKIGKFNFNGELKLSNILDERNVLTNPIVIGANGDNTAYCKIGLKTIFTINADGTITMNDGYTAKKNLDLITKSVTNELNKRCDNLQEQITELRNFISTNNEYINSVLSRYNEIVEIQLATTENIPDLYGNLIIDNVTAENGYKVLVKNQDNPIENGIYTASNTAWNRENYNIDTSLKYKYFRPMLGKVNKEKLFYTPQESFNVDVDKINFIEYAQIDKRQFLAYSKEVTNDINTLTNNVKTLAFGTENTPLKAGDDLDKLPLGTFGTVDFSIFSQLLGDKPFNNPFKLFCCKGGVNEPKSKQQIAIEWNSEAIALRHTQDGTVWTAWTQVAFSGDVATEKKERQTADNNIINGTTPVTKVSADAKMIQDDGSEALLTNVKSQEVAQCTSDNLTTGGWYRVASLKDYNIEDSIIISIASMYNNMPGHSVMFAITTSFEITEEIAITQLSASLKAYTIIGGVRVAIDKKGNKYIEIKYSTEADNFIYISLRTIRGVNTYSPFIKQNENEPDTKYKIVNTINNSMAINGSEIATTEGTRISEKKDKGSPILDDTSFGLYSVISPTDTPTQDKDYILYKKVGFESQQAVLAFSPHEKKSFVNYEYGKGNWGDWQQLATYGDDKNFYRDSMTYNFEGLSSGWVRVIELEHKTVSSIVNFTIRQNWNAYPSNAINFTMSTIATAGVYIFQQNEAQSAFFADKIRVSLIGDTKYIDIHITSTKNNATFCINYFSEERPKFLTPEASTATTILKEFDLSFSGPAYNGAPLATTNDLGDQKKFSFKDGILYIDDKK